MARGIEELSSAQELLWASGAHALLVVFQAIDAAGKDGTIKHVMSGVNPQGIQVVSFKQPSAEELAHDFLWRISKALPERGRIGIFNRSHYEEVIAVRVHPEWLERQGARHQTGQAFLGGALRGHQRLRAAPRSQQDEDREVLPPRLEGRAEEALSQAATDPRKMWKFNAADVAERAHWDEYMAAYEDALSATSTEWAPWYVVPADHKWLTRVLVAGALVDAIQGLDLRWPEVSEEERRANEEARRLLEAET